MACSAVGAASGQFYKNAAARRRQSSRAAGGLTRGELGYIINLIVNYNQRALDLAFGALAHPIRRGILARLATGETTVAELAKPFKVSAPAISKHMRILEDAGLLSRRKQGREHRCKLEAKRMEEAEQWIERQRAFWNDRLDALERYLKEDAAKSARARRLKIKGAP